MRARVRHKRKPGEMNGLEKAWAKELQKMKDAGEIVRFSYEAFKLNIGAPRCTWSPDFYVIDSKGFVEIHECKGFMETHAAVKIKVAATQFPEWTFKLIRKRLKKNGGGLDVQTVGPKYREES